MLTALSLPRPSSPWQPAQAELYVVRPGSRVTFAWFEEEFCCPSEEEVFKAHRSRESPSSGSRGFRITIICTRHIVSQWSAGSSERLSAIFTQWKSLPTEARFL